MTSRTRWLPAAFLVLATSACSSSSGSSPSYNYSATSQPRAVSSSAPKSKG